MQIVSRLLARCGRHFAEDIFKFISLNESVVFRFEFIPGGPIDNTAALVQIMAWLRTENKPLFEPKMV